MKKCLVIGSSLVDIYIDTSDLSRKRRRSFVSSVGGKGFNIAATLRNMGVDTDLLSSTGKDMVGSLIAEEIKRLDINLIESKEKPEEANIYINVSSHNYTSSYGSILPKMPESLVIPQLNWGDYLVIIVSAKLEEAELEKLKTIKAAYPKLRLGLEMTSRKIQEIIITYLHIFDFFICNSKEAEALMPLLNTKDLEETINRLYEIGIEQVVMTLGEDGAMFNEKTKVSKVEAYKIRKRNIFPVGAGDAVTGCISALHYFHQLDIRTTLRWAVYYAYSVVGCKKSYIDYLPKKLESFLAMSD